MPVSHTLNESFADVVDCTVSVEVVAVSERLGSPDSPLSSAFEDSVQTANAIAK